jgi:hypothetical protein
LMDVRKQNALGGSCARLLINQTEVEPSTVAWGHCGKQARMHLNGCKRLEMLEVSPRLGNAKTNGRSIQAYAPLVRRLGGAENV